MTAPVAKALAVATPTAPRDREPILDLARGVAILGILLVNIDYMRGPGLYRVMAGLPDDAGSTADRVVSFLVGWLVSGKFLASFAILFGIGAAVMSDRFSSRGQDGQHILRRRYALLGLLGLAHMVLLFPGDILFVYGAVGLLLRRFLSLPQPPIWRWTAALLGGATVVTAVVTAWASLSGITTGTSTNDPVVGFLLERHDEALRAFGTGSYADVLMVHGWESLIVQTGQLLTLPWLLGLMLLGVAIARTGLLVDLSANRTALRKCALVGLAVGLPLSLAVGPLGPTAMGAVLSPDGGSTPLAVAAAIGLTAGAPALALGYLAVIALVALRFGTARRLTRLGRVALSAYVLQSALALVVFAGLGRYARMGLTSSMLVVIGIWAVTLLAADWWSRGHLYGPLEWAWRMGTYGRRLPLRRQP